MGRVIELREGDRVIRKESIESFKDKEGGKYSLGKDKRFSKVLGGVGEKLCSCKLSRNASWICFIMMDYIRYDSGILAYENGKILRQSHLIEMSELCKSEVSKAVKELIDNEIIVEIRKRDMKCYAVNPYVFVRGNKISKDLYEIFKDTKWYERGLFSIES